MNAPPAVIAAHNARVRRTLLLAGCVVIAERGVRDAHLRDIARTAGKTCGSLFKHWPDKTALVADCVLASPAAARRVLDDALGAVLAAAGGLTPEEQGAVQEHVRRIRRDAGVRG